MGAPQPALRSRPQLGHFQGQGRVVQPIGVSYSHMMRFVIVGAGPAGAATALLLARHGAQVSLVDRERDQERVFRGEALMPHGLDALLQMGLGARLEKLPGAGRIESWQVHLDRRLITNLPEPAADQGERAPRIVAPGALIHAIVDEASQYEGFSFRAPLTVRDLLRQDGRVVGVRADGPKGSVELPADLVIGGDGRASVVRKRAGLELTLLPESYDIVWFKIPVPERLREVAAIQIFASGPDAALGYISWDGRLQIAWLIPKGSWRQVRGRDWLAECAELFPEWLAEHTLAHRDDLIGPSPLDVIVGRCPVWSQPGLLLLGDAAHPMSPIRAQGINMALRDAIVAANHLVPLLAGEGDLERACLAIQREREKEILPIQKLQIREVRGQRWARDRPWLMKPLLKLAPLLAKGRMAEWAWRRQQRPLRFGIREVRLEV